MARGNYLVPYRDLNIGGRKHILLYPAATPHTILRGRFDTASATLEVNTSQHNTGAT